MFFVFSTKNTKMYIKYLSNNPDIGIENISLSCDIFNNFLVFSGSTIPTRRRLLVSQSFGYPKICCHFYNSRNTADTIDHMSMTIILFFSVNSDIDGFAEQCNVVSQQWKPKTFRSFGKSNLLLYFSH